MDSVTMSAPAFFGYLAAAVGFGFLAGGMVFGRADRGQPKRLPVRSVTPDPLWWIDDDEDEHALNAAIPRNGRVVVFPAPVSPPRRGGGR